MCSKMRQIIPRFFLPQKTGKDNTKNLGKWQKAEIFLIRLRLSSPSFISVCTHIQTAWSTLRESVLPSGPSHGQLLMVFGTKSLASDCPAFILSPRFRLILSPWEGGFWLLGKEALGFSEGQGFASLGRLVRRRWEGGRELWTMESVLRRLGRFPQISSTSCR